MPTDVGRIYLVACVGQKLSKPAPAKDIYTSSWFRKARAYVERTGCVWFILSAKHGLVHPNEVIAPYDTTLNTMRAAGRRAWAGKVLDELGPRLEDVRSVAFLAGLRYRQFLAPHLKSRGLAVSVPMEGLRIGEQLQWLERQIDG